MAKKIVSAQDMMANLVREFPADLVIHRGLEKFYTGAEMVQEIENGTEVGRVYASNLMRTARDSLARQAETLRQNITGQFANTDTVAVTFRRVGYCTRTFYWSDYVNLQNQGMTNDDVVGDADFPDRERIVVWEMKKVES
jgi:hypothetical protein